MKRFNATVEMTDGRVLTATTSLQDGLRWEATAKARGWPLLPGDIPQTWEAFTAFAAMARTGQYSGKWEQFQSDCVGVELVLPEPAAGVDPDTAGDVEPTPSGLTPD